MYNYTCNHVANANNVKTCIVFNSYKPVSIYSEDIFSKKTDPNDQTLKSIEVGLQSIVRHGTW